MSGKKKDEPPKRKDVPNAMKFVIGGSAGMTATVFVQPLDLIKNRMQLSGMAGKKEYRNTFHAISSIIRQEGFLQLYNGLSAGLLRQALYSSTRLGVYTWLFEKFRKSDGSPPGFLAKASMGSAAGIAGSIVGNPAELALIRMTADGKLPASERRNYKNAFDAVIRIAKEEGILTLWRGVTATMARGVIVNAVQLATYSQCKEIYYKTGFFKNESIPLHLASSMTSGLFTTIFSMPVDILKTRLQNMKTINGKPEFSGLGEVFTKLIKNEGVLALWKGFTPYLSRVGPHTVLTLVFLEQYTEAYKKYMM